MLQIRDLVWLRPLTHRPALLGAVAVLTGSFFALWPLSRITFIPALAVILIICPGCRNRLVTGLAIAAFFWMVWQIVPGEWFLAQHENTNWQGSGHVIRYLSAWQANDSTQVQAIVRIPGPLPLSAVSIAVRGDQALLPIHGVVNFSGYLQKPETAANPGGFDSRDWLGRQGVYLQTVIYERTADVIEPGFRSPIDTLFISLKQQLSHVLDRMVGSDRAPLLLSILIGDTSGMTAAQNYYFRQAGLSHLMAVSGANIAFWFIPLNSLLRRLRWRRRFRLVLMLVSLVGFGFLTGWQVSVTRAILMMAILVFGQLQHRRADPLNSLGWVILILALISPLSLLNLGLWLSLAATFGLLSGAPYLARIILKHWPKMPEPLAQFIGLNLAVQLLVLPITAFLSHQYSLIGLLANLPAAFLVEWITGFTMLQLLIVPAADLLALLLPPLTPLIVPILQLLARPLATALDMLANLAVRFGRMQGGRLPVNVLTTTFVVALLLTLYQLAVFRNRRSKHTLFFSAALTSVLLIAQTLAAQAFQPRQIWFFSVGQGDSTLIRSSRGQTLLIDAGKPETGFRTLLPALDALGIRQIDQLILTHGHADHAGGASDLLASGRVGQLVISDTAVTTGSQDDLTNNLIQLAESYAVRVQVIGKNDTILLDHSKLCVKVLSPPDTTADLAGENEKALHIHIDYNGLSVLLMSDCTPAIEQALLDTDLISPVQVLHVAHHGSKTTTLPAFLTRVQPQAAVISVGPNTYGHPAQELLERLHDRQVPYFRTDQVGAICIALDADPIRLIPFRKDSDG